LIQDARGRAKTLGPIDAILCYSTKRLVRLYVVATSFDSRIAQSTLDNYEPAEPLSVGALAAGGLAALWGWAATRLISLAFQPPLPPSRGALVVVDCDQGVGPAQLLPPRSVLEFR
jgi:hypothetical protein